MFTVEPRVPAMLLLLLLPAVTEALVPTCCPAISLTSRAGAAAAQPHRLGRYLAREVGWRGRQIYKHADRPVGENIQFKIFENICCRDAQRSGFACSE